jgi:Putative peptidoglycan binding domain
VKSSVSPGGPAGGPEAGTVAAGKPSGGRARGRGRWVAAGVVAVVIVAGLVVAGARGAFSGSGSPSAGAAASAYRTATATVARRSLVSQTPVDATLGYAGSWDVVNQATGTFTALPAAGQVVREGQVIYHVSGAPVVLLYGSVPAWRDLSEALTGPDVTELNAALVKLGYASAAALGPRSGWDYFSAETAYALGLLQSHLGLTVTGTLPLGQAVFLPGAARITGPGTTTVLGAAAAPGTAVLTATSTSPVVSIALDAGQQTEVKKGDKVSITLPNGTTTPGVISSVGTVATSSTAGSGGSGGSGGAGGSGGPGGAGDSGSSSGSGSATITVLVSLTDPKAAGGLDQAPVTVEITTGSASNALVVPVTALLAQPGGKYQVEQVTGGGGHHHLVPVTPGIFDDISGLVQVTGTTLAVGDHVVVPAP